MGIRFGCRSSSVNAQGKGEGWRGKRVEEEEEEEEEPATSSSRAVGRIAVSPSPPPLRCGGPAFRVEERVREAPTVVSHLGDHVGQNIKTDRVDKNKTIRITVRL